MLTPPFSLTESDLFWVDGGVYAAACPWGLDARHAGCAEETGGRWVRGVGHVCKSVRRSYELNSASACSCSCTAVLDAILPNPGSFMQKAMLASDT